MTQTIYYKDCFDEYLKSAFQLEVDLRFWKHFLATSIKNYQLQNPENRWINKAGFSLYNLQPNEKDTWLHISEQTRTIEIKDLEIHSDNFFVWVMNLSVIRIYNAAELLILKAIQIKYFPSLSKVDNNKKNINKLVTEIKNHLTASGDSFDSTNNRYIIDFLKLNCKNYATFLELKVNIAWSTRWVDFYEFFSILRNVITHHAMILTPQLRNNINSIAKDAFNHYFFQPVDRQEVDILKPKSEHDFLFFVSHVNDFVSNTLKFIADETDFQFIGFHKA